MLNHFNRTCALLAALSFTGLAGCSLAPTQTETSSAVSDVNADAAHSTILLVSLDDGSIVRQTVDLDADICVKTLDSSTTTCLTQGDAIVNNRGIVVGYEMQPETIELQGYN